MSMDPYEEVRMKCLLILQTGMKYNTNGELHSILNIAVVPLYILNLNW